MWNLLNFVENVRNISDSPQKKEKNVNETGGIEWTKHQ